MKKENNTSIDNHSRKEFISAFKVEAEDHIEKLNKGLLTLEKEPQNFKVVKLLFREAHTLKGAAQMMGFSEIKGIAHRVEDIFGVIQEGKLEFSSHVADVIFRALDSVNIILKKIVKGGEINADISGVCKDLEEIATADRPCQTAGEREETKGPEKLVEMQEKISLHSTPQPEDKVHFEIPLKEEYIHISVSRVNKLLNLIGETIINKLRFSYYVDSLKNLRRSTETAQRRLASFGDAFKAFSDHPGYEDLFESLHQCNLDMGKIRGDVTKFSDYISTEAMHMDPVLNELQQKIKEIRMLPCSTIFEGFPRLIRDISREQQKDVNLVIEGENIELDKKVLEKIKPSLIHILRNCVDHGIERPEERESLCKSKRGTVLLSALQEGGSVLIEVQDDGRGLDIEEIKKVAQKKRLVTQEDLDQMSEKEVNNLIFTDGFSTSPIITDVSGRGVGLDVVKTDIEELKGTVKISSQKGIGTKVKLILPLTITVIRVLLIKSNDQTFGLPMLSVEEFIEVGPKDINTVNTRMAIRVRDQTIPLVRLDEVLNLPKNIDQEEKGEVFSVVVVSSFGKQIGFMVDQSMGEEEIFMKSLGSHLGKARNVSGAAILSTGEVIVILDVADLISEAGMVHPAVIKRRALDVEEKVKKLLLIVEDSLITRELEKNMLEFQGYKVDVAIDGIEAMGKIAQTKPDLIISDIQMPRMDGFELCKTIRGNDEYKEIPIIMVTSLEKGEYKRRGIEVGADAYIVKAEFDQANLLSTIERLIG